MFLSKNIEFIQNKIMKVKNLRFDYEKFKPQTL